MKFFNRIPEDYKYQSGDSLLLVLGGSLYPIQFSMGYIHSEYTTFDVILDNLNIDDPVKYLSSKKLAYASEMDGEKERIVAIKCGNGDNRERVLSLLKEICKVSKQQSRDKSSCDLDEFSHIIECVIHDYINEELDLSEMRILIRKTICDFLKLDEKKMTNFIQDSSVLLQERKNKKSALNPVADFHIEDIGIMPIGADFMGDNPMEEE